MKKIFFILSLLITSFSASAKKWDTTYINKLLLQGEIDKVLQYYLNEYPTGVKAYQIADLYIVKKDFPKAISWYERNVPKLFTSKKIMASYVDACRNTGQCTRFLQTTMKYATKQSDTLQIKEFQLQCEKVEQSSMQMAAYDFVNYTYNTPANEFYISMLRKHPIYLRDDQVENPQIWQIVRLYQQFTQPISIYKYNNKELNIQSLSFSKDGNTAAFASIQKNGLQQIFLADYLGGQMLNIRPFPYNLTNYSLQTPALNGNANELYFASNQPNGFGEMDIWKSKFENGQWSKPENAGNIINSAASELSPFVTFDNTEQLYYSSNKDGGIGGFDLYKAIKKDNFWQSSEWLPSPINSTADETSIIYDPVVKAGYFTSNRMGGKGGFDIYRYIPQQITLKLQLKDSITSKPVEFAAWKLLSDDKLLGEGLSNANGEAMITVADPLNGKFEIQKEQYNIHQQIVSWKNAKIGDTVVIKIKVAPIIKTTSPPISSTLTTTKPTITTATTIPTTTTIPKPTQPTNSAQVIIQIQGRILDSLTGQPIKDVKLKMFNLTSRKIRELEVDATGKFSISLFSGQEYEWQINTAKKEWVINYSTKSVVLPTTQNLEVLCGQKAYIRKALK